MWKTPLQSSESALYGYSAIYLPQRRPFNNRRWRTLRTPLDIPTMMVKVIMSSCAVSNSVILPGIASFVDPPLFSSIYKHTHPQIITKDNIMDSTGYGGI